MTKKFWEDGIHFECQGTGRCCTSRGSYGYVYFTLADRRRLAKHLGISTQSFTLRYCKKTNGNYHLKDYQGPCQFLKERSCSIYEARPSQCRTWPFWPENMNARTWSKEIETFCPGVGKGKLYTKEDIQKLLDQDSL